MAVQRVSLSRLRLNPHNDRHGPLRDEPTSLQWLLEHRKLHMRALAEDLAERRMLFERPLVRPEHDVFIVFDGNRRTSCLKLLLDPGLAPSEAWREFFTELATPDVQAAFAKIDCEVQADLELIDEILLRRHTGSQDGVGQSPWDPDGKSFFLQRTGKAGIGLGQAIETALKAEKLIDERATLPWSNIERLFSSEPLRRRAGISFSGGELSYLTDKNSNLATLARIAGDVTAKGSSRVALNELWNNTKKGQYLDRLKADGLAIDSAPARAKHSSKISEPNSVDRPRAGGRRNTKQRCLIASSDLNPFVNRPGLERSEDIWRELQFNLQFELHDNSIAVLTRVLLELSVNFYARSNGIQIANSDPFARRVSSVADAMLNRGLIDKKAREIIRKFESDKPIVSAHSMHQYVHNHLFLPSQSDLRAIWIVVRALVVNSVK